MSSGGVLGSSHVHQPEAMTELPHSPTTSSSQVRTRCAEISSQPMSETVSPFCFNSVDEFRRPPTDAVKTLFPSSRRREMQLMVYRASFQSGETESNKTHSSGTSAGSSQLSNGKRHTTAKAGKDTDGSEHVAATVKERSTSLEILPNFEHTKILETQSEEPGSSHTHHEELAPESPQSPGSCLRDTTSQQAEQTFNQPGTEHLESPSERARAYPGTGEVVAQSNRAEIFPAYSTSLMASDPYNFPTGAELLELPTPGSRDPSRDTVSNGVQDESGAFGSVQSTLCPNQSHLVPGRGYSSPTMSKASWAATAAHLYANNVHGNLQGMSALVEIPVPSLLSESVQEAPGYNHGPAHNRDRAEGSYFSSPQTETGAMQLCLNPGYGSSSSELPAAPGNLLLMAGTGAAHLNTHTSLEHQQRFLNIPPPPAVLAHSAFSQRSHDLAVSGPHLGGNQGYSSSWRNGGNELLFIPRSGSTVLTQTFSGQLSPQLQQADHEVVQYGSRRSSPLPSVPGQVQQHAFFQNGDHGQTHTSMGICQGLSLSLSSQDPSPLQLHHSHESEVDAFAPITQAPADSRDDRAEFFEGRYTGILSRFRPQRDELAIAEETHHYGHTADGKHQLFFNDYFLPPSSNASYGCKYLKLSQVMLNEICILRKYERKRTPSNHLKTEHWSEPTGVNGISNLAGLHAREALGADLSRKEFLINASPFAGTTNATIPELRGREPIFDVQHVQGESREEIEKKKLKLRTYLEEVDKRYRTYREHMMDVNNQFNATAGLGAAVPYTALALQAMARHFRSLRDAVSGQLRAVQRALGEQDISPGYARRELTTFRFVSDQLRQQRAMQQLGMLQQHAWRPQRGLPERAVSVLRSWLFEHFLHPYPKDSDKLFLAKQTGLTRSQVSNWFINARVRLWKPMVEEMYMEEFNNSDEGGSGERNSARERRRENEAVDYDDSQVGCDYASDHAQDQKEAENHPIILSSGENGMFPHSNFRGSTLGTIQSGSPSNNLDFDADDQRGCSLKKARHSLHSLASPVVGVEIESDGSPGNFQDPSCRADDAYGSSSDQDYAQHSEMLASSGARFGGYGVGPGGSLTGYTGSYVLDRATTLSNTGVSLTLGLRHSDGLTISGADPHQKYGSNQGQYLGSNTNRSRGHFDSGVDDTGRNNVMDIDAHSEIPVSHSSPDQDDLRQRSRTPSHLVHEFVAQG